MQKLYYYSKGQRYKIMISGYCYDVLNEKAKEAVKEALEKGITLPEKLALIAYNAMLDELQNFVKHPIEKLTPTSECVLTQWAEWARDEVDLKSSEGGHDE